jgi:predicted small metal-binding protein
MAMFIKCECGFVARGEPEDAVIEKIRDQMRKDHPDVLEKVSRDDLLGWIERE